jgi:hypothetical protein
MYSVPQLACASAPCLVLSLSLPPVSSVPRGSSALPPSRHCHCASPNWRTCAESTSHTENSAQTKTHRPRTLPPSLRSPSLSACEAPGLSSTATGRRLLRRLLLTNHTRRAQLGAHHERGRARRHMGRAAQVESCQCLCGLSFLRRDPAVSTSFVRLKFVVLAGAVDGLSS